LRFPFTLFFSSFLFHLSLVPISRPLRSPSAQLGSKHLSRPPSLKRQGQSIAASRCLLESLPVSPQTAPSEPCSNKREPTFSPFLCRFPVRATGLFPHQPRPAVSPRAEKSYQALLFCSLNLSSVFSSVLAVISLGTLSFSVLPIMDH